MRSCFKRKGNEITLIYNFDLVFKMDEILFPISFVVMCSNCNNSCHNLPLSHATCDDFMNQLFAFSLHMNLRLV